MGTAVTVKRPSLVDITPCVGLAAAGGVPDLAVVIRVVAEAGVVRLAHPLQIARLCAKCDSLLSKESLMAWALLRAAEALQRCCNETFFHSIWTPASPAS